MQNIIFMGVEIDSCGRKTHKILNWQILRRKVKFLFNLPPSPTIKIQSDMIQLKPSSKCGMTEWATQIFDDVTFHIVTSPMFSFVFSEINF